MRTGENRWERVVMVCISTGSMQWRECWIREISIENLLRRLCIKCEIYVPRFVTSVTANDFPWAAGDG